MKNTLLTLLAFVALSFSVSAQSGITITGLVHQPNWNMTENGFWASGGVRAQLLGKEALRGFPIRLQTGLTASYLSGNARRFANFSQLGLLTNSASINNHIGRLGASIRALSWPGKIRVFAEAEVGAQYMFSTGRNLVNLDILRSGEEFIGGSLGYYYGLGGGIQFRLLPFMFAQAGVRFTEGSKARFVDLDAAFMENGSVQYNRVETGATGFVEYELGLYFRLGNHDRRRNNQTRRGNDRNDNRSSKKRRRSPTYWDRG